jgi:hypothetical protein
MTDPRTQTGDNPALGVSGDTRTTEVNDYPTSLLITSLLACIALCLVALLLIVDAGRSGEWFRLIAAGFAYTVFLLGALVSIAKLAGWHE